MAANRSVYYRPLIAGDIDFVAERMRSVDREEAAAAGCADPRQALVDSIFLSSHIFVGVAADRDEPLYVFGVVPVSLLGGKGRPWMLATERASEFGRALIRDGHRYINRMLALYPHLENYVDARNETSIRWLKRLGFRFHEPEPYGPRGMPFCRFEMST